MSVYELITGEKSKSLETLLSVDAIESEPGELEFSYFRESKQSSVISRKDALNAV
jgi:hypothetical protein